MNLLIVIALLAASSAFPVIAAPSTPGATPGASGSTRLYVGHDAQLTAEMPADWKPDEALNYDYAGLDGFIASEAIPAPGQTLAKACAAVATADRFAGRGKSETISWRGMPAYEVRMFEDRNRGPVAIVFAHPRPAADGHNAYVGIFVDAAHVESILKTVSFDPAKVSADAYLDAAIDFIQTHSLWRDELGWPKVRTEAHALIIRQPVDLEMGSTHRAIRYVISQITLAGGDGHNFLSEAASSPEQSAPPSFPVPTGKLLPDAIGYMSIPQLAGDKDQALQFASAGREVIRGAVEGGACGWIVDLRSNQGGNMYPMVGGIAPLLHPGEVIRFRDPNGTEVVVTFDGKGGFEYDGTPMDPSNSPAFQRDSRISRQPVAVLIGPNTWSSGEATALAFAGRDQTRFFGGRTGRFTTAPAGEHLFDGAVLRVSAWWMVGPRGAIYPNGIASDVEISSGNVSEASNNDAVVKAAMAWLGQQPACANRKATPGATAQP